MEPKDLIVLVSLGLLLVLDSTKATIPKCKLFSIILIFTGILFFYFIDSA